MISVEVLNKETHTERVNILAKQSVMVVLFQRTSPEDWCLSNENNHFYKMANFEQ